VLGPDVGRAGIIPKDNAPLASEDEQEHGQQNQQEQERNQ